MSLNFDNFNSIISLFHYQVKALNSNPYLWKKIDGRADQFEYDFSIICQAVKKTKNIGQCSVYYKSRTYEDGKKCTWDVGFHAFKRIILDRF